MRNGKTPPSALGSSRAGVASDHTSVSPSGVVRCMRNGFCRSQGGLPETAACWCVARVSVPAAHCLSRPPLPSFVKLKSYQMEFFVSSTS